MVQAHQKQIVAWEEDRQRVSNIKHVTCITLQATVLSVITSFYNNCETCIKRTLLGHSIVSALYRVSALNRCSNNS